MIALPLFYVDDLIKRAILEDINYLDTTTDYLIPEDQMGTAYFVAKADGVLCGVEIAMRVFELLDSSFQCEYLKHDGDFVQAGDLIV